MPSNRTNSKLVLLNDSTKKSITIHVDREWCIKGKYFYRAIFVSRNQKKTVQQRLGFACSYLGYLLKKSRDTDAAHYYVYARGLDEEFMPNYFDLELDQTLIYRDSGLDWKELKVRRR